jgi:hypothetical protein
VRSVECRVQSVECKVWSVKCRVWLCKRGLHHQRRQLDCCSLMRMRTLAGPSSVEKNVEYRKLILISNIDRIGASRIMTRVEE